MANLEKSGEVVIVMVPFPAQGHLNQLLHFSRLLAAYKLPIHYVGTTTHVRQAKIRLHGWDPVSTSNIVFHELETPAFLSPPPDPTESYPSHLLPSFLATSQLREPVGLLLRDMSLDDTSHRVVVIYDSLMASVVQDVATIPKVESYSFESVSAFCIFRFLMDFIGKTYVVDDELVENVPSYYHGCLPKEVIEFCASMEPHQHISSGKLYNTCRAVEGKYVDMLMKEEANRNIKHWAIGPFNPFVFNRNPKKDRHVCLDWLDKQESDSVIFVSFGTTTSFTDEQINEIAIGLEMSDQKFIWVLRDADKGDVFDENVRRASLPKGYEARIEGRGIVVRDWAPQLEILAHSASGGFMSHCGWNSCMESISCGVPIATWPMHSDQPNNAVLITKVLKIGVVVKDWTFRNEIVTALTVEKGVRRLMAEKEGDEMRKRASELAAKVKMAAAEGGTSRTDLDSFVAHITR